MPSEKNHLYSNADYRKDQKRQDRIRDSQQFSRFSVASPAASNNALLETKSPAVQIDRKPQIGIPYDDTRGAVSTAQVVSFNLYGSQYTFFEVTDDVSFTFDSLPTGRHIDFTLDLLVNKVGGVAITFPSVLNPPVLAGDDGDRYVLHFVGANRADPDGVNSPVQTWTYLGGTSATVGGSQTPWLSDIDADNFSLTSIQNLTFGLQGQEDAVSPTIFADASGDMVFNVATGDSFFFTINGSANDAHFILNNTTTQFNSATGVRIMELINRNQAIIDLDQVGDLRFRADNDAAGEDIHTYARLLVNADDVTAGSEDGRLTIDVLENGALASYITMNIFSNPSVIQFHRDIDMITSGSINNVQNLVFGLNGQTQAADPTIFTDASGDMVFNVATGDSFFFTINGSANDAHFILNNTTTQFNTAAGVRIMELINRNPTAIDLDQVGDFRFRAIDDAATLKTIGRVLVNIDDVTAANVNGRMTFQVRDSDSLDDFMVMEANTAEPKSRFEKPLSVEGNFIEFLERAAPTNPGANRGKLYVKDVSTVTHLFFIDSAGTETDLTAGGGGTPDKIEEGNSKVEVIDPGTGQVDIFVDDLATAKYRFTATALSPVSAGVVNLGTSSLPWGELVTFSVELETGGTVTSNKNEITSDAGGMILNIPSGDRYEFAINGAVTNGGIIFEEDRIEFGTTGRAHRIDATTSSINIIAENSSDDVELWPGSARSNEALIVQDANSIFKSSTTGAAYQLLIQYSDPTTTGQPAIGNIGFQAEDSANIQSAYAGIVTAIDDDTSTGRDGRMQLVVANSDGTTARSVTALTGIGMDIQSDAGIMKLSFFGVTPVAKQNPSVDAAAIHAALQAYGLFV